MQQVTNHGNMIDYQEIYRIETGPLKIGDDWPGLFVRGDDCIMLVNSINHILSLISEDIQEENALLGVGFIKQIRDEAQNALINKSR